MRTYKWLIGILLLGFMVSAFQNADMPSSPEEKYMRFHVVANSDSPEDQELKLKVRDRLLNEFGEAFRDVDSIDEAGNRVKEQLQEFEKIANDEIRKQGREYNAKATVGFYDFPIKAYGNLVLPAGEYYALKVVIGEGQGSNWWCVMFPPLCFVDISHGVAMGSDDDMNEDLVEYRFKAKEWLDNSFPKMIKLFSLIPGL